MRTTSPGPDLIQTSYGAAEPAWAERRFLKSTKRSPVFRRRAFTRFTRKATPDLRDADAARGQKVHLLEVTAYNVGDAVQNYGDPCQSANGENICAALDSGLKRCAANFVPFGTKLHIAGYGECTVTDRMNRRYNYRVDIAMKINEKRKAVRFGLKRLMITILGKGDD